ncbi:MAG: hypothetical protein IPN33_03755 [Saprospiraceae bacterium]|nr:hypothetical protein [Saprospiraceae bacterium]
MIDIVKEIRDYFSSQDAFQLRYDLAKNRHLVKGIIPQEHWIPGQTIWFKSDNNGLIWSNCFKIDLIKDIDGNEIYEFENDFTTIGRLGYGYENREYEVVAEFALTYLVYKYPGSTLIQADHSFLLDKNQKIERDFFRLIEKKIQDLGINRKIVNSTITFENLSSIWNKVEKSNQGQVQTTSYFYWNELYANLDLLRELNGEIHFYGDCKDYQILSEGKNLKFILENMIKNF